MFALGYINWDPNPVLFQIGGFAMTWYGFFWGLSLILGHLICIWQFKKRGLSEEPLVHAIYAFGISGLIGARLFQIIFYEPAWYLEHPEEILKIWHGGLASHGGVLGSIIGLWAYCRYKKVSFLAYGDVGALVAFLAGSMIRVGNLMNGEIVGRVTDVPWAFQFARVDFPRHPVVLYEAIAYFTLFLIALRIFNTDFFKQEGKMGGFFLVTLFGVRFFLEFFKEPSALDPMGFSISQTLNIPAVLAGTFLLLRKSKS